MKQKEIVKCEICGKPVRKGVIEINDNGKAKNYFCSLKCLIRFTGGEKDES